MGIAVKQDLPRSPVNLSAEYVFYTQLTLNYSPLPTVGFFEWTSPSSGHTYTSIDGGVYDVYLLLGSALYNYMLNETDWNNMVLTINETFAELQLDVMETRSLVERQLNADVFVNQTGYGAYTLFDSTSDGVIDNGSTTATINTTSKTCTFDSTGTKVLKLQSRQFNNNFTDIKCRIDNYVTANVVNTVNNSNSITIDSPNYKLEIGDQLRLRFAYGSNPYTNATINSVGNGLESYSIAPSQSILSGLLVTSTRARPLILNNGFVINAVQDSTNKLVSLYVSKYRYGYISTPINLGSFTYTSSTPKWTLGSYGNTVYLVQGFDASTIRIKTITDLTTTGQNFNVGAVNIATGLSSISNCHLAVNQTNGHMTVTYSCTDTTYPLTRNIHSKKSTDGGVTWTKQDGTAGFDQITNQNSAGLNYDNPYVFYTSAGNPNIIYDANQNPSYNRIFQTRWTGSWTTSTIQISDGYATTFSSATVHKYGSNVGRIEAVWYKTDATDTSATNLSYTYSDDNGATWSSITKITNGNVNSNLNANISTDLNGNVHVMFLGYTSSTPYLKYLKKTSGVWGSIESLDTITDMSTVSSCDNWYNFDKPFTIFRTSTNIYIYGIWNYYSPYLLSLNTEVDATAGQQVVIPTQYKITQNSTPLVFDSVITSSGNNGQYLQYKLVSQAPNKTINLTVTGKSTAANSVAYTVE